MTVGPWIDRAWIGLLPDASRFVPEANRAITKALDDLERRVTTESGRITRRFDDMARGANNALDGIGRNAFDELKPDADRAARGVNNALDGVGRHAFDGLKTDADRAARGVEDAFDGVGAHAFDRLETDADRAVRGIEQDFDRVGDRAFDGLEAQANQAAEGIKDEFQQASHNADQALDRVGDQTDFGRVRRQAETTAEGVGQSFDDAQRQVNTALDDIGRGAPFAGIDEQADRTGDQVTRRFQQLARDSNRELRGIGGPAQFLGLERQADRAADRIGHDFLRARTSASFSLGGLTTRASVAGGLIGAALGTIGTAAVTMGLQSAAAMEQAEISFTQLLGSGAKAKDFLADLNQFAATTPFELPGLIAASRQLLGAGQAASDVIPIMTALGDATGALGLEQDAFQRIMLAVTQAMNKGRLQGEELMQMQEAGLPVTAMLAKALGVTTKQVSEMSQAGKLQSDVVLPKLFDQMHKDYGGSMIKQSRTLNGLWSTFVDTTRNALREGIQPLLPAIKDALPAAARILEGSIRSITGWFRDDLGPELGRLKQAWDDNGAAIISMFTGLDESSTRGQTAAQGLIDVLVTLTNTVGDVSRVLADLDRLDVPGTLTRWGDATREHVVNPLNTAIRKTGEWIGVNQVVGFITRDVTADLADLGVTLGQHASSTDTSTTATDKMAIALRNEAAAARDLKSALEDEHDADLTVRQGKLDVARAQARLTELRKDGKQKSFEYKQAELDLERAQNRLRDANAELRTATTRSTAAERLAASASTAAAGAHRGYSRAAYDGGRAGLKFGDQVRDGLLRIPKGRIITVDARARLDSQRLYFSTASAAIREQPRAEGGPIYGSGTGTSDSILAAGPDPGVRYRLSRDEHVWTAEEVRRFGGHAAMEAWRKRIRTMDASMWQRVNRLDEVGFQAGGSVRGSVGLRWQQSGVPEPFDRRLRQFREDLDQSVIDAAKWDLQRLFAQSMLTGGSGAGFGSGSWRRAIAELLREHVPYNVVSTFRAGARTHASGSVSFHALNRAVDLDGPDKLRIWQALTDTNPTELIYSRAPLYKSRRGWRPISQLDPITRADHYSHVHAAYQKGTWETLRDQLALLHQGEMVVPKDFASGLRSAMAGGGESTADAIRDQSVDLLDGLVEQTTRSLNGGKGQTDRLISWLWRVERQLDRQTDRVVHWLWRLNGKPAGGSRFHSGGTLPEDIWGMGRSGRAYSFQEGERLTARNGTRSQPTTTVNIQSGAVQISVQGPVQPAMLPQLTSNVEDGLHAVLRELRTGTAA